MFKISRKVEYALIALKYMSQKSPGQLTTAKEICQNFHTPFDPMARVLQILSQHKILRAEQGAHGGYQIQKDLSKVSMRDLSIIILGPVSIANCLKHEGSCSCDVVSDCNVIGPLIDLNEKINNLFHTINISDLIQKKHQAERVIKSKKVCIS